MACALLNRKSYNFLNFAIFMLTNCLVSFKNLASSQTDVTATVPVNPVPEGGMLALHCRISNLQKSQEVAISRIQGADSESISYSEKIIKDHDNRFFLAVRHLSDGSFVYFLSIMEITRAEAGQYSCKVIDMSGVVEEVAADAVKIQVSFLPSDNYPLCKYSGSLTMQAGTPVTYNCTSELGYPNVTLHWSRTGTGHVPKPRQYYDNGLVTSVLTLRPNLSDSGTMLICTVKSNAFPDTKTCHIGPISVTKNPNDLNPGTIFSTEKSTERPRFPIVTRAKPTEYYCQELCEEQESSLFYWIIATVVSACFAFVLFILGIMLCIKLRYRTVEPPPQCIKEDIYAELDKRYEEDAVYMALDRSEKVYNTYNQTLPRRNEPEARGNVATGNTSL